MTAPASDMSRLGLGTVQFGLPYGISNAGGQVTQDEARAILALAHDAGIDLLDTAAAYGTAEATLGQLLAPGHTFRIVTKTLRLANGLDAVVDRAHRSVRLLGTKPLDTLMVHSAEDLAGAAGDALWRALERLRDDGLFGRVGISAYAADDPCALARRFRPEAMQVPLSLLDQRLVADGALGTLQALGVEVHVRSLFLQGLLFLAPAALPPRLAHAAPRLTAIRSAIADAGTTPLAAALRFVLDRPEVDHAVVGVTSRAELAGILTAATTTVAGLDMAALALDDPIALTPSLWST